MAEMNSEALRLQMINAQLRTVDVNDLELLEAFAAVPRENFAAPAQKARAYADGEVASSGPAGRKILSARTLGLLLRSAAPEAGEMALTVGAGSGYCAAVLAALGLEVVAMETDSTAAKAALAATFHAEAIDGPLNEPPKGRGPFDVIVINGAYEVTPDALIAGLKEGGRLVGIDARSEPKRIVLFERSGGGVSERALYDAAAEVLPGFARAASFVF